MGEQNQYYLCFTVNRIPDLTLVKYSVFDGSGVDSIIEKHGVFLRQLHRLGSTSNVYFHLLYYYNPDNNIPKGKHLSILFYATAKDREKLEGIREFLISSVLSTYYDFFCYEIATNLSITEELLNDGSPISVLSLTNISGEVKKYGLRSVNVDTILSGMKKINNGEQTFAVCEIASDANAVLSFNKVPVDAQGRRVFDATFKYGAYLTKKDYSLPAQNRLQTDDAGEILLYSIMEWEPCDTGRLFNVLKLMEGYNKSAALRIDIFPVDHTQAIRQRLPYADVRRRIAERNQGKDDNSESVVKSWDKYLNNLMKFPQFIANVVAFADSQDIAVMLADSVAAEAVESGTYQIEMMEPSSSGYSLYESDNRILHANKEQGNYVAPFLSLYTLEEVRPMFSFPILYPGESIECQKETDPTPFKKEVTIDKETGEKHEVMSLGTSSMGYDVTFPLKLFKKHAFVAGVPGAGKTNTMLYLVTTLWRNTEQHIPFLVLEPAKQEYRALAKIPGMEKLCVFSPGADTYFPLHINPFEFPIGLTLAEHIANLNAVFAGAFELIPPSPFLIDACIEKVYLNHGWNINERNEGKKTYPTMQELYDSLEIAVEESGYEGESKANIRSVMEVRIGSLLRREIGHVYNVSSSSVKPTEWLDLPVIIELEALGEGPANFMSLLISTFVREVLKIRKTSDVAGLGKNNREIEHIIFYEEAHNLIGPNTDDPVGGSVDPKISATKYLVKMLAEVRALGEGIVIADQLPTAMAPEVLKNTGLKIGHRITAQDDRGLLGGTMSASPDQLEEQGTFGTGQALIFYEGLLKPFKMRVAEWEKGTPRTKYNSPTNKELYNILKDNEQYKILMSRSALIMQEKMRSEFDIYTDKLEKIVKDVLTKTKHTKIWDADISKLEAKKKKCSESELEKVNQEIRALKKDRKNAESYIDNHCKIELKKTLKLCANFYYAYITLSNNYGEYKEDMYIEVIHNYLSLFKALSPLKEGPILLDVIIDETREVMNQLKEYVDYSNYSSETFLSKHPRYKYVVFECEEYLDWTIIAEGERIKNDAYVLSKSNTDDENGYSEIGKSINDFYLKVRLLADYYKDLVSSIVDGSVIFSEEDSKCGYELAECKTKENNIYITLVRILEQILERFSNVTGLNRKTFVHEVNGMFNSLLDIVDYCNKSTSTILSDWDGYYSTADKLSVIHLLKIEILFERYRDEKLRLKNLNADRSLTEENVDYLCRMINPIYLNYKSYVTCISSAECRKVLFVQFIKELDYLTNISDSAKKIVYDNSQKNIDSLYEIYESFGKVNFSSASDIELLESFRRKL